MLARAFARLSTDADFLRNAEATRLPLYFQDADGLARYLDETSELLDTYMHHLDEGGE